MEKFLKWLAEHIVELIALFVTTSFGGIAAFSLVTYVREFWERNPLLTALYTCLCVVAGIGVGIAINLSKYLIWKKGLEEKARKCAEGEAERERQNIEYARERVKSLSYDDKSVLKDIFENGEQIGNYDSFNIMDIFANVEDLFNSYEIGDNQWVVELTDFGKFCAEHSQDILDKVKD